MNIVNTKNNNFKCNNLKKLKNDITMGRKDNNDCQIDEKEEELMYYSNNNIIEQSMSDFFGKKNENQSLLDDFDDYDNKFDSENIEVSHTLTNNSKYTNNNNEEEPAKSINPNSVSKSLINNMNNLAI